MIVWKDMRQSGFLPVVLPTVVAFKLLLSSSRPFLLQIRLEPMLRDPLTKPSDDRVSARNAALRKLRSSRGCSAYWGLFRNNGNLATDIS